MNMGVIKNGGRGLSCYPAFAFSSEHAARRFVSGAPRQVYPPVMRIDRLGSSQLTAAFVNPLPVSHTTSQSRRDELNTAQWLGFGCRSFTSPADVRCTPGYSDPRGSSSGEMSQTLRSHVAASAIAIIRHWRLKQPPANHIRQNPVGRSGVTPDGS